VNAEAVMFDDPSELNATDARAFLDDARQAADPNARRRLMAAAVYFAIAAYETAKERGHDDGAKKAIKAEAARLLPHYALLHDVRIHNFHRNPLPAANARILMAWVGPSVATPGVMTSLLGSDQRVGGSGRPVTMKTTTSGLELHDRDRDVWVTLDVALERFLGGVPAFLQAVHQLIR
jgi:hypothetical protein